MCAGWWLVNTWRNGDGEEGEEGGAPLMGYVPGSFLKKCEEGTQETTELEEKLVIGHACWCTPAECSSIPPSLLPSLPSSSLSLLSSLPPSLPPFLLSLSPSLPPSLPPSSTSLPSSPSFPPPQPPWFCVLCCISRAWPVHEVHSSHWLLNRWPKTGLLQGRNFTHCGGEEWRRWETQQLSLSFKALFFTLSSLHPFFFSSSPLPLSPRLVAGDPRWQGGLGPSILPRTSWEVCTTRWQRNRSGCVQ